MLNRLQGVFSSLERHNVRYVVIGGIAAVLYGVPRAPFDLEILMEATPDNARSLLDALTEAGLGTAGLTSVEAVLGHEITIFEDRVRIDVQTSTPGLAFAQAWNNHVLMDYQGQTFRIVSRATSSPPSEPLAATSISRTWRSSSRCRSSAGRTRP